MVLPYYRRRLPALAFFALWILASAPLHGQSLLQFTKVSTGHVATGVANSQGASWIDFDNDGHLDLYVANVGTFANFVYRNDGSGTLERVTTGALAEDRFSNSGNCWADADNDGDIDVFATGSGPAYYLNDGAGAFTRQTLSAVFGSSDLRSWACSWGDYDSDGYVDLVLTHPQGFVGSPTLTNFLFHNNTDGTFTAVTNSPVMTGFAPYTVPTWYDFDEDGDLDLFIGSGPASSVSGPDYLYKNQLQETGTATFERIEDGPIGGTNRDGQVINWIDYDNDRDLDVFDTTWGGSMGGLNDELYRNDEGVLTRITSEPMVTDRTVSLASVWADFDNDADLDVFVTNGSNGAANRLYENNGDGTFTRIVGAPFSSDLSACWGATAGDVDNDGDLDLYITNAVNSTRNIFYLNALASDNNWIKIRLVGTASNRSAIGARVHARSMSNGQAVWQQRDVSSQNSFNGHNSQVVHFGLADAAAIDSLVIAWPSGVEEIYTDLDAGQFLQITEGESLSGVSSEQGAALPETATLLQNYPNPFSGTTSIAYSLPAEMHATITVYDLLGRAVATIVDQIQGPGQHRATLDMGDLPAGMYIYQLQAGNIRISNTLLHLSHR